MLYLKYVGEEKKYPIEFKKINKNIVQVMGNIPIQISGFDLISPKVGDCWGYKDFTTIYREIEGGVQFSNDGSVYVAPPEPEPLPDPEPVIPTLEEVKILKKQEIELNYQMIKTAGVDVEISTGKEHFPLTNEDVTFLMGKQFEIMSGANERISYQDSENRCKFYSLEDMQLIIQQALLFVNYQTTYRNNLCEWVDQCGTFEEVDSIYYGCDIPEAHQNEVYKSYLVQIGEKK